MTPQAGRLIFLPCLAFALTCYLASLSQVAPLFPWLGILKQAALALCAVALVLAMGGVGLPLWPTLGFASFLLAGLGFSLPGGVDATALLTLAGFATLFGLFAAAARPGASQVAGFGLDLLAGAAPVFLGLNLWFLNQPAGQSAKGQFRGLFENPNGFAGFCGLFALLSLWAGLRPGGRGGVKALHLLTAAGLAGLLVMSGSRGGVLALLLGGLFLLWRGQTRKALALAVGAGLIWLALGPGFPRDLWEVTGRAAKLAAYLDLLNQRFWVWGAGYDAVGARVRSELSYLDLTLSAGIGVLGVALFWGATLVRALRAQAAPYGPITGAVVVFVLTASLVEGYLANVASFITLMAYLCAGLIWSEPPRRGT